MQSPRRSAVLPLLAALVPAVPWLLDLHGFGRLQYNDYYGIFGQLVTPWGLSTDPVDWLLIKSNEHTTTVPALFYALNYWITAGDNRGLSLLSILFAVLCAYATAVAVGGALRLGTAARSAIALVAAALWFTPAAVHSYVMGFSGTIWITANLLAVGAMLLLLRIAPGERTSRMVPVVAVAVAGAFTYTTNLSLWPALLAGAVLLRLGWRMTMALVIAMIAVVMFQWVVRVHPEAHPPHEFSPSTMIEFAGCYMSYCLTGVQGNGASLGIAAMAVAAAVTCLGLLERDTERRRRVAPFVMMAIYGFGNALGTAVGRGAGGVVYSGSSRYVSLAVFFWIGTIGMVWWVLQGRAAAPRRWPAGVTATLVLAAVIATWTNNGGVRDHYHDLARWNRVAEIALRHGILEDTEVLGKVLWVPEQFRPSLPWLRAGRHVPFDRPFTAGLGEPVDPGLLAATAPAGVHGRLDAMTEVRPTIHRLQGWAGCETGRIEDVLIVDQDLRSCGEVAFGLRRPDLTESPGPAFADAGFAGYAHVPTPETRLRMFVRLEGATQFVPIPGELVAAQARRAR